MTQLETTGDIRDVDDPAGVDNPFWQVVRGLPGSPYPTRIFGPGRRWEPESYIIGPGGVGRSRQDLCVRFAWAITDPVAVAFVAEHAGPRVVEVGAGAGYWAWQLAQRGVDVLAYDADPPDLRVNHYHAPGRGPDGMPDGLRETWHPVLCAEDAAASAIHSDRTLLLCWPPYDSPMAADTLAAYTGDRVVYIGEGPGGCTGDDRFHRMLGFAGWDADEADPSAEWVEVADHAPVQWWGIHDRITVYDRRGPS